jgi:MYXO-CTERM domain-containing protein
MLSLNARRVRTARTIASCLFVGATIVFTPFVAEAHFRLDAPASWMSQDSVGGPQKNGPCAATANPTLDGNPPVIPSGAITVFQPGQTVSVSITATIGHPGWYRIALMEGASSTQSLTTIPDPKAQTGTNCTPAIMTNPVWSTTQPVIADGLPAGSTANTQQTGSQTFRVTIPQNANCTNARPCTLQVIMVMTDHPANDCYYHHCADIVVGGSDGGASAATDAAVSRDAATSRDASTDSAGSGGSNPGTGGSTGAGGNATGTGGVATGAGGVSTGAGGGLTGTGGVSTGAGGGTGGGGAANTGGSPGSAGLSSTGGGTADGSPDAEPPADSGGCALTTSPRASGVSGGIVSLIALALFARRRRRPS